MDAVTKARSTLAALRQGDTTLTMAALGIARAFNEIAQGERPLSIQSGGDMTPGVDLVLHPASLTRPSLIVEFPLPYAEDERATRLALSSAGWDGLDEFEAFRELGRPLYGLPHVGKVHEGRPVVLAHTKGALAIALSIAEGCNGQVHVIGGYPTLARRAGDVVWWPALPTTALALIGRSTHVVGCGRVDPLVLDAVRLDIPVSSEGDLRKLLPGLVVGSVLGSNEMLSAIATVARQVRLGRPPPTLLTARWLKHGRALTRAGRTEPKLKPQWELVQRRYAKFRREPERYFRDSRYPAVRQVAKWWFAKK